MLSRKTEESVEVGGSSAFGRVLKVTVLEIASGHVKLGFEANEDVPIHRSEVWEQIQANGCERMGIGHSEGLGQRLLGGGRWSEPC